jgi:hypothetical protein
MKAKRGTLWLGTSLIILLTVSACGTPQPTATAQPTAVPTETTAPAPDEQSMEDESPVSPLPTPETEAISPLDTPEAPEEDEATTGTVGDWVADGVTTDGEYTDQADFGDIRLWWRSDAEYLYVAMEGDTTGWVAVGINPERGMQGANYLFGYVENGEARLWDAYGTAPTGPNHPPDEELGGSDDIVTFVGTEDGNITRFEFQIPLDSGDDYDQVLTPGQSYPIIIAIGDADGYNAYHRRYDQGSLTLAPSP